MKNKSIFWALAILLAVLVSLPQLVAHALSIVPRLPDTSATSAFTQTINAGVKSVDIVSSSSYETVALPSVALGAVTFGFNCQAATGTFGTDTEVIYVKNPDAADGGWTLTLAAADPAASWVSAGVDMDFNDSSGSGCTDDGAGVDADSYRGQMTVDPSVGLLTKGQCLACTTANITKGTLTGFVETSGNSITLLTAAAGSDDIGDWRFSGVAISQTIPAEQPAASDYSISLVLTFI